MVTIKLAFRNLVGAGLRTWLNVSVLSFAFVVIVLYNGILDGWNRQAYRDTIEWAAGHGQLWDSLYDPYDPYCLQDAHAAVSARIYALIESKQITPVLITQATIFPGGHLENILLKGIDPSQTIVNIPSASLRDSAGVTTAVIGKRMAFASKLKKGDNIIMRWRDKHGTFDASTIHIGEIFSSNVPSVDNNQIWISLDDLQKMTGLTNEATLFITSEKYTGGDIGIWKYKDLNFLMKDINEVLSSKRVSSSIIYGLLLAIALLAIFDTQILSVFRRQREIGTYIALGMTRWRVIKIFTVEGSAHSILAIILGSLYGIPLLAYLNKTGIPMPKVVDSYGLSIGDKIVPVYSIGLILSTVLLVILSATIVSFFPTRKIAKMKPTDALKGKIQ